MKKLFYVFAVAFAAVLSFSSCTGQKTSQQGSDTDSLMLLTLQQTNEIAELSNMMNALSLELDQLNGEISLGNNDQTLMTKRQHIFEQLQKVKENIDSKQEELDAFKKKYQSALGKNKELTNTIDRLNNDIVNYRNTITSFENMVEAQKKQILALCTDLANTQIDLEDKIEENKIQQDVIKAQDDIMNEGFYIIASKSELKKIGLAEGGTLSKLRLSNTFDTSAFTRIDIRKVKEIPLNSKDAKILTPMPEGSYQLVKGEDKKLTLVITDAAAFWSQSKFLVVRI